MTEISRSGILKQAEDRMRGVTQNKDRKYCGRDVVNRSEKIHCFDTCETFADLLFLE